MRDTISYPGSRRWGQRAALVATLLTFLFLSTSPCTAQKPATLRRVEFVGLKKLTEPLVMEASGLKIGDMISPEVLDAAADKLMQSGWFKTLGYTVRTANNEASVTFKVEEAARNLPVVFENFVWFSEAEIARAIRQDVPFFDGTAPEAGTTTEKIAAALQRLLSQKKVGGRVEHMPYTDTKGKQEILFTVEGVKIPVCSLHFPGATAISEGDLIKASQPLLKADYSRKDAGGFALYTLFPLYRHLGYLRAEFEEPTAAIEESSSRCAGGVAVTIPVDEGLVYSWNAAEWSGNQALTTEELTAALGMKDGELADGLKIDNGLKEVRKAYGKRGYLAAALKDSSVFDDPARRVSYRFSVTEGPRYFMGNLIINGLSTEEAERLRTKWTLGSNAVYDASYLDNFRVTDLREFMAGLAQRTGSRAKVEVEIKPNTQKQTVDVTISFK